jgi:c-di-GMP-binding flagellar brake protein YcgR
MDRRTKQRVDLQLICSLGESAVRSTPLQSVTENISRDGILMRWLDAVPLPAVGSALTVEFALPESEGFGKRAMRCRTTVVRITESSDGQSAVGLHIEGINFINAQEQARTEPDLRSMPAISERVQ